MSLFSVKIFCLTVPKIFLGKPLSISLISGVEKCKGWIVKFLAQQWLEPQTYCLRTLLSYAYRCHLFSNQKSWQFCSDKKNDPTDWIIFPV